MANPWPPPHNIPDCEQCSEAVAICIYDGRHLCLMCTAEAANLTPYQLLDELQKRGA